MITHLLSDTIGYAGPMGNETDPTAVVDSHGRVFGVHGVRVVDASIVPFAAPGHSMSLVCKSSDLLSTDAALIRVFARYVGREDI